MADQRGSFRIRKYGGRVAGMIIALSLVIMLILLSAGQVLAASNFHITDYDIHMTVNEDDTYDIRETIQVEFTKPSHGIYRSIPKRTKLDRDGQLSEFIAYVKKFKVESGQPYEDESDSYNYMYRVGDSGVYADQNTEYVFSYIYDTGGDHFKGGDEVYHNIIGTTWEALSIDHVSFTVEFPKDIDMDKVGVRNGWNEDIPFEAVGTKTVKVDTDTDCLSGLTIRAVLPEGYFTREARDPKTIFYIITGILGLLAIAGIFMWRKYGVDPVFAETVEFYPPDGLSAPELTYLYNEAIEKNDVVSMLLTLADKGYVCIREIERDKPVTITRKKRRASKIRLGRTTYEIDKLRDYDGDTVGEKEFMDGLFSGGKTTVCMDDLMDKFYLTLDSIKDEIEGKYEGKLYDKTAEKYAKIMKYAAMAGVLVIICVSKMAAAGSIFAGEGIFGLIFPLLSAVIFCSGFIKIGEAFSKKAKVKPLLTGLLITALGFFFAFSGDVLSGNLMIPFVAGLGMCLLLFILSALCGKKTEWLAKMQARIKGYARFLKTAEKDQIETLAKQDPGYFYSTLAFAAALGVTSVFIKQFASMATTPPTWYHSPYYHDHGFTPDSMTKSMDSLMSQAGTIMSSSPSDGGGGGSFSGGGGGGGGGGGSW